MPDLIDETRPIPTQRATRLLPCVIQWPTVDPDAPTVPIPAAREVRRALHAPAETTLALLERVLDGLRAL